MSSHSRSHRSPVGIVLLATFAMLCSVATLAPAQEPPGPKWEFYGGYSFFHPGADVHGVLPLGLLPVSSRLEANPRGIGAGITYDFNRWFGLTLDSSTLWNSGETGNGPSRRHRALQPFAGSEDHFPARSFLAIS